MQTPFSWTTLVDTVNKNSIGFKEIEIGKENSNNWKIKGIA